MAFPHQLKLALASQSVSVDRTPIKALSNNLDEMVDELGDWAQTAVPGVAVSYFFRQHALFISAQFELITHHNAFFACSWQELHYDRIHNYGFNLLQVHVDSGSFKKFPPADRFGAMHFVLTEQVDALIKEFQKHIKISPLILWENVLGSLLWFYANLERSNPRRSAEDMEWLFEPANWKPAKTSYMRKLLGDTPLSRAVSGPLRQTCCLYKELPDFAMCTYCPKPN